jgi:Tol biopolymer transport system component
MISKFRRSALLLAGVLFMLSLFLPAAAQDTGADETRLSWSPDGERLAFTSNRAGQEDVYVMDADGSNANLLVSNHGRWGFHWSPDGEHIAVVDGDGGKGKLYILTVATGDLHLAIENKFENWFVAWSPDGQTLLYHEFTEPRTSRVLLYSVETQTSLEITDVSLNGFAGSWSADGKQLAIRAIDPATENYRLYIYDIEQDTLSDDLLADFKPIQWCCPFEPVWSPDNTWLAFSGRHETAIYGVNIQTHEIETLLETGVPVHDLVWLADGRIVYLTEWRDQDTLRDFDGSTPPGIYVALPGETPQLVAEGVSTRFLLAPDEQHLLLQNVYTGTYHGKSQPRALELIDLTTFEITEVDVLDTNSFELAWSPDGAKIAAALCVDGDADIFIIDGETAHATNITPDDAFTGEPVATECGAFG